MSQAGLLDLFLKMAYQGLAKFHLEVDLADVEAEAMIAQGASAKVYRAKYKGKPVALKRFNINYMGFSEEEFRRELAISCILEHDSLLPVCLNVGLHNPVSVLWCVYSNSKRPSVHSVRIDDKRVSGR